MKKKFISLVLATVIVFSTIICSPTQSVKAIPNYNSKTTYVYSTKKDLQQQINALQTYYNSNNPVFDISFSKKVVLIGIGKVPKYGAIFSSTYTALDLMYSLDKSLVLRDINSYKSRIQYMKNHNKKYAKFRIESQYMYVKPPQIYGWKVTSSSFCKYTNSQN